jgi:hypothetical protein
MGRETEPRSAPDCAGYGQNGLAVLGHQHACDPIECSHTIEVMPDHRDAGRSS